MGFSQYSSILFGYIVQAKKVLEMTANQPVETWNTKWADFVIVVKTGEELKCHKVLIAKASP